MRKLVRLTILFLAPVPVQAALNVVQAQQATVYSYTNLTVRITTRPGDLLVIAPLHIESATTMDVACTDSAHEIWTNDIDYYPPHGQTIRSLIFQKTNARAVTSVTCSWHYPSNAYMVVYEISGAASSPLAAKGRSVEILSFNIKSLPSGTLTTTDSNSILLYAVSTLGAQSDWRAGEGFTIPPNGSNQNAACQYQIVSSAQTGVTTLMSWSNESYYTQGIFVAFKAAQVAGSPLPLPPADP
jgi:hypothetical protein